MMEHLTFKPQVRWRAVGSVIGIRCHNARASSLRRL